MESMTIFMTWFIEFVKSAGRIQAHISDRYEPTFLRLYVIDPALLPALGQARAESLFAGKAKELTSDHIRMRASSFGLLIKA
jgi:sorbitol-specific phosphotransferase system component IIC